MISLCGYPLLELVLEPELEVKLAEPELEPELFDELEVVEPPPLVVEEEFELLVEPPVH